MGQRLTCRVFVYSKSHWDHIFLSHSDIWCEHQVNLLTIYMYIFTHLLYNRRNVCELTGANKVSSDEI